MHVYPEKEKIKYKYKKQIPIDLKIYRDLFYALDNQYGIFKKLLVKNFNICKDNSVVGKRFFTVFNRSVLHHVKRARFANDVINIFALVCEAWREYTLFQRNNAAYSSVYIFQKGIEIFFVEIMAVEVACAEKIYAGIAG